MKTNGTLSPELAELLAAARDMTEQVGSFIDLDDRVDNPAEHDLFDVLVNLEAAIKAMDRVAENGEVTNEDT